MANEKTPVVWDDTTNKHRPLGTGEKMGGLDASSLLSSDSGNLLEAGSDGLAYLSGSGVVDPRADNLLEESDRGKLQVTVDRIAEWLDGHPQDAAALADAINVVSGDEGNVIVEGTDKGAFLSKGAIAAAVAGMTDAQKAQLADAIAARIASDIADGTTIVASGGKLHSDPTNATVAQKKAINQALADSDSGLVVDSSTGKLKVDFSNMPTDKFEELLAGLKMPVPLSANLSLHVDTQSAAASDTIIDGRGTAAKPFKTINGCISWAAGYYSLGKYSITVYVHAGIYNERVVLPDYTHASGRFIIRAYDFDNPPTIARSSIAGGATCVSATGGVWELQRIRIVNVAVDQDGSRNWYYYCMMVENSAVTIRGCEFDISYYGASSNRVRMFGIGLGAGSIMNISPLVGYAMRFNYHVGNAAYLHIFSISSGAVVHYTGLFEQDDNVSFGIQCSGDATTFMNADTLAMFSSAGGGDTFMYFTVPSGSSAAGKKYQIAGGAGVSAPVGGFPGSVDGTVESSTYSWYKQDGA